jgi:hypothetical protein
MPPAINQLTNNAWAREHDQPGTPLIPSASLIQFPTGAFPQALQQVMQICSQQGFGRLAAGSHWALSTAAVSDHTFVETHDPGDDATQLFPAMGLTLFDVVPGCLTQQFLQTLAAQSPPPYDANTVVGVDNFASADVTVIPESTPGTYFVHCETGKQIFQLYAELDQGDNGNPQSLAVLLNTTFGNSNYLGPWAFETLGGAGGQTVFGALTTGTHGGDFSLPPIADAVEALHLVVDGGAHFWIERGPNPNRPLQLATSDTALNQLYGAIGPPGGPPSPFTIIRDDDHFNAVLVSAGRFGIVYSVVLRVVRQYSLHFVRSQSTWQQVKGLIADPNSALFLQPQPPLPPGSPPRPPQPSKFLQIAVCATPQQNFGANFCGITQQWNSPMAPEATSPLVPFGRPERVGNVLVQIDPIIGGPRFSMAGNSFPLSPNPNQPDANLQPSFLDLACQNASFMAGILNTVITDIQNFVTSNGALIGGTIATIAAVTGGGLLATLLALIPFLAILIPVLEQFLKTLQNSSQTRLGQALNDLRSALLGSGFSNPPTQQQLAGLFIWQAITNAVFASQQSNLTYAAISYAVHDGWNYLDRSCSVDADSIEVFFDAADPMLITFVNALLVFETRQEQTGKAFAGYISLRFTGKTAALLGMEQFARTCSVEVSGLRDVTGSTALIDFALTLALNPNFGGILHWGQRNAATMDDIQRIFGDAPGQPSGNLHTWRNVLSDLTDNGRFGGFSSAFTRQVGLEIVTPLIKSFTLQRPPIARGPILLDWDCSHNPPPPRTTAQISWTPPIGPPGSQNVGLSGSSQQIISAAETGVYQFVLTATATLNGESRQTTQALSVTVP